ncbi:Phosphatidylcholine transfer protein [Heterocephalus glaber]|uniref:Phosphatidylcholine transfer protein n=1 Tax=Heterocephalus glaber TaxID=10181 RepID=G5BFA9_HETGA|nr:Phosphatidylcholine transfer protein [Heterocephalus glaber]
MASCFSEKQFREACAKLQQPALARAKWQLLVETLGISIYQLLDKQTRLYEYKVFGILKDCSPALLTEVYVDLDYRKQDYVYIWQWRDLDVERRKIHLVLAPSISLPQFPEKSGVIQVNQYKQSLASESDGKEESKVFMYHFHNPGGQIPPWLLN